jgi:hypothetical protein
LNKIFNNLHRNICTNYVLFFFTGQYSSLHAVVVLVMCLKMVSTANLSDLLIYLSTLSIIHNVHRDGRMISEYGILIDVEGSGRGSLRGPIEEFVFREW